MDQIRAPAWSKDRYIARFRDVFKECMEEAELLFFWLSAPERIRRMEDAEIHHDRPALAGVVLELEELDTFRRISQVVCERHQTLKRGGVAFRQVQFVGALAAFILRERGWRSSGRMGRLSFSRDYGRAVRFIPPKEHPAYELWAISNPDWVKSRSKPKRKAAAQPTRAQQLCSLIEGKDRVLVCRRLGVTAETLRNWMRRAAADAGIPNRGNRMSQPWPRTLDKAKQLWGDKT